MIFLFKSVYQHLFLITILFSSAFLCCQPSPSPLNSTGYSFFQADSSWIKNYLSFDLNSSNSKRQSNTNYINPSLKQVGSSVIYSEIYLKDPKVDKKESLVLNSTSNSGAWYITQHLIFSLIIGFVATFVVFVFFQIWNKRNNRVRHEWDDIDSGLAE